MLLHQNETLTKAMLQYDLTKIKNRYQSEAIVLDAAIITANLMHNLQNGTQTKPGATEAEHYYNNMVSTAEHVIRESLLQHLVKKPPERRCHTC